MTSKGPVFEAIDGPPPAKTAGRGLNPESAALLEAVHANKGKWVRIPCADAAETRRWQQRCRNMVTQGRLAEAVTRDGDVYVRAGNAAP